MSCLLELNLEISLNLELNLELNPELNVKLNLKLVLTFVWPENRDFYTIEYPIDLRPVCKFKFVCCGPVEKNRALYLSRFNRGGPTMF